MQNTLAPTKTPLINSKRVRLLRNTIYYVSQSPQPFFKQSSRINKSKIISNKALLTAIKRVTVAVIVLIGAPNFLDLPLNDKKKNVINSPGYPSLQQLQHPAFPNNEIFSLKTVNKYTLHTALPIVQILPISCTKTQAECETLKRKISKPLSNQQLSIIKKRIAQIKRSFKTNPELLNQNKIQKCFVQLKVKIDGLIKEMEENIKRILQSNHNWFAGRLAINRLREKIQINPNMAKLNSAKSISNDLQNVIVTFNVQTSMNK